MKTIFLVASLLLLQTLSVAQDTYVVTNKGDTIFGRIKLIGKPEIVEVKILPDEDSPDKTKRTYRASGLRSFSAEGIIFESLPKERINPKAMPERIFVRKRVAGDLSLYEEDIIAPNYSPFAFYFKRSKDSFVSAVLKDKKKLLDYFKDCKPVVNALNSGAIRSNDLDDLVKLYNKQCSSTLKR
jgi:hypothetical protein